MPHDPRLLAAARAAAEAKKRGQTAIDTANQTHRDVLLSQRSEEEGAKFAREVEQALPGGPNAAENQARRDEAMGGIRTATSGALRALQGRLASQGVRGGAAAAAQAAQLNQGAAQMADAERKLMLEDMNARRDKAKDVLAARLAGRQFGAANANSLIQAKMAAELQQKLAEQNKNSKLFGIF